MIDIFIKWLFVFDLYTSRHEVCGWPINFSSSVESPSLAFLCPKRLKAEDND